MRFLHKNKRKGNNKNVPFFVPVYDSLHTHHKCVGVFVWTKQANTCKFYDFQMMYVQIHRILYFTAPKCIQHCGMYMYLSVYSFVGVTVFSCLVCLYVCVVGNFSLFATRSSRCFRATFIIFCCCNFSLPKGASKQKYMTSFIHYIMWMEFYACCYVISN